MILGTNELLDLARLGLEHGNTAEKMSAETILSWAILYLRLSEVWIPAEIGPHIRRLRSLEEEIQGK